MLSDASLNASRKPKFFHFVQLPVNCIKALIICFWTDIAVSGPEEARMIKGSQDVFI